MRFLVEVGQISIALFISGAVAVLVGPTYVAVAALVVATCGVLLLDAARQRSAVIEVPLGFGEMLSIAGTSIVFGAIWPAIPIVLTWKRLDGALDDDDRT